MKVGWGCVIVICDHFGVILMNGTDDDDVTMICAVLRQKHSPPNVAGGLIGRLNVLVISAPAVGVLGMTMVARGMTVLCSMCRVLRLIIRTTILTMLDKMKHPDGTTGGGGLDGSFLNAAGTWYPNAILVAMRCWLLQWMLRNNHGSTR